MSQRQARKPKSHRGCTSCRASKRKCSEDKPACGNCIRDGKVCEYDIDVLFRMQTYDGTQQPNRRMRQIITPLKVAEQQPSKSNSPRGSTRSSPAASPSVKPRDLPGGISIPRRHSDATASLAGSWDSPFNSTAGVRKRRPSRPPSAMGTHLKPPSDHDIAVTDTPSLTSLVPSISHNSSSSMTLDSYALSVMGVIDPQAINVSPAIPVLTDDEALFFEFFLRELPSLLPFSELFPSVCNDILAISTAHIPLTQSILAISSYLVDKRAKIPPIHGLTYLEKALTRVQEAISMGTVDEGLIAAVFLLALLSTFSGEYKSSRRHLQGMSQLFRLYHQHRASSIPPLNLFGTNNYPIVMLLWRMAIRMEYHVAFYDSGQGAPIFPPIDTSQESTHIEWISQMIDKSIPNGVNWALASFALDDLMNRAGHLSHKFSQDSVGSIGRAFQIQDLIQEHLSWKRRPVVAQAIIETVSHSPDTTMDSHLVRDTVTTFLQYDPVRIQNSLYATLLIRHFMTGIYISLISDPRPGPVSPERFRAAIDICRHFVALYSGPPYTNKDPVLRPVDNCMALITAGFTLREETYPNEFEYCVQTLSVIAQETGFTALLDVVDILRVTHNDKSYDDNWARGYQMKILTSPGLRWDSTDIGFGVGGDLEGFNRPGF